MLGGVRRSVRTRSVATSFGVVRIGEEMRSEEEEQRLEMKRK